jgi:hypothetical protein
MQAVISAAQAKQITGGRTPVVPIVYEEAIKALDACLTLDDAKLWSDKADALAAWAKIYHDDKVDRQAKALKLHAYRRMGKLAGELRPSTGKGRLPGGAYAGSNPGPRSLLIENGLSDRGAQAARRLASLSDEKFNALTNRAKPPAPQTVFNVAGTNWTRIVSESCLLSFEGFCARNKPLDIASAVPPQLRESRLKKVRNLIEWLDEFERHLSK